MKYTAYPPGYIHDSARIGEGTKIGAGHDISRNVVIGHGCLIQCHVSIPTGTRIGNYVFIGPKVGMSNDKYLVGIDAVDDSHLEPPVIEDYARIGLAAKIGAGVTVGRGAVIGQAANVIRDVQPFTLVIGNPARYYANVDENGRVYRRDCLGQKCRQYGGSACTLRTDAVAECAYIRGDDVDLFGWIK